MRREPINFLERETQRVAPRRRGLIFFIIIILLFAIGGCVRSHLAPPLPEDATAYDPVTLEPKKPEGFLNRIKHFVFSKDVTLDGQRRDRINVLVLGQGGIGHDGPFLTDTIIVASIKPSTGEVAFTSVPRDLLVKIPGHGERKINHANAFGEADASGTGPELSKKVVEKTFDIDIDYYIRIDFKAFEEVIDDVGGVRVNVERSFVDAEYPAPNEAYQTVSFEKGPTTMDGETALTFVRSRHGNNGEGSDFARSKRQQKVILALKEKILSFQTLANPVRLKNIVETLGNHVVTDMEFSDMLALMKLARELDTSNIITLTLDNSIDGLLKNGTSSLGAFILEPVSGNFHDINKKIKDIFEAPQDLNVAKIPDQEQPPTPLAPAAPATPSGPLVEIQNGTWRAGLAARTKKQLTDQGFAVSSIGNTNERPYLSGGLYVLTKDADAAMVEALQDLLDLSEKQTPPSGERGATSTDILIILGEDFVE